MILKFQNKKNTSLYDAFLSIQCFTQSFRVINIFDDVNILINGYLRNARRR